MYFVKSTTTSRRFAGHSSNESRTIGAGSRPPSLAICDELHALLAVGQAVLALQLVAAVAEVPRRLRPAARVMS